LRRAQEAKAARDAAAAQREQQVEAALADYFEAVAQADRVRADARRKAELLLDGAEQAAGGPLTAARDAVRRLRELTGSIIEVAGLCGITASAVRDLLSHANASGAGDDRL
jgi:hypothetical protein